MEIVLFFLDLCIYDIDQKIKNKDNISVIYYHRNNLTF